jgi:hypothetical protein
LLTSHAANEYAPTANEYADVLSGRMEESTHYPDRGPGECNHAQVLDSTGRDFREGISLAEPDPVKPWILQTDASQYGVSAVLLQNEGQGGAESWVAIAYHLLRDENVYTRYSSTEQELFAVFSAMTCMKDTLDLRTK